MQALMTKEIPWTDDNRDEIEGFIRNLHKLAQAKTSAQRSDAERRMLIQEAETNLRLLAEATVKLSHHNDGLEARLRLDGISFDVPPTPRIRAVMLDVQRSRHNLKA